MSTQSIVLDVLLVEDDHENLALLMKTLPSELDGNGIHWQPCDAFDKAKDLIAYRRYDLVVTDIYRDREGHAKGDPQDESAREIVSEIRKRRFCPIVVFTDGSRPQSFEVGHFVRFADKSGGNDEILSQVSGLLATGIPQIVRRMHEDLDRSGPSYLWTFLESQWERLQSTDVRDLAVLERLVRRRAAMQLARPGIPGRQADEVDKVLGLEYYIYPLLSDDLRLGAIIRNKEDRSLRVILTPHCYLTVQLGDKSPRAEHVLTIRMVSARDLIAKWPGRAKKKEDDLRRRTQLPADLGRPAGRYCFLPGFLDEIPDTYCDLLQAESLPIETITADYMCVAVLDAPFAEALQACFTRFYSFVGLPSLDLETVRHLMQ